MSDATPILHMLTPQKHMSPFDVNMAADAGFKVIVPYVNVLPEEVTGEASHIASQELGLTRSGRRQRTHR